MSLSVELFVRIAVVVYLLPDQTHGWVRSKLFVGWKLQTREGVESFGSDTTECLVRCLHAYKTQCRAVSFIEGANTCTHFTDKLIIREGGQQTVVLTEFSSALYIAEEGNLTESADRCSFFSAHVMTYDEMVDQYNDGYNHCSCGWTDDGTQRLVSQLDHPDSCGGSSGARECRSQALTQKVYCTTDI